MLNNLANDGDIGGMDDWEATGSEKKIDAEPE